MSHLEVDAQKVNPWVSREFSTDRCLHTDKYKELIYELSEFDLKCVIFLLMECINVKTYLYICEKSKEELETFIQELIHWKNLKTNIFIEIFGLMKKYHYLKRLNFCKHEFHCSQQYNSVLYIWKFLYSLCLEVDDKELRIINDYFFKNPHETGTLEQTICKLFVDERVSKENLHCLSNAFRIIKRMDLIEKVESYHTTLVRADVEDYPIRVPTQTDLCGLAVIINQENFQESIEKSGNFCIRRGSHIDRDVLSNMWKRFGFQTETYDDKKSFEIIELFENICRRDQNYDIFVACILSHGHAEVIYGSDGKEVRINNLVDMVANKCRSFYGKPKLFFIQACQEYETSATVSHDTSEMDENSDFSRPPMADVYKALSTVPGHVSYRDPNAGSIFISILVEELAASGHKQDIDQIMKRVKEKVSCRVHQMPITSSTLRRNVVLKRLE